VVAHRISRAMRSSDPAARDRAERMGMLTGAGLIAGEALTGIFMAVPIVMYQDPDVIAVAAAPFGGWPGLAVAAVILWGVYRVATRR
jgi:hypothetical protein